MNFGAGKIKALLHRDDFASREEAELHSKALLKLSGTWCKIHTSLLVESIPYEYNGVVPLLKDSFQPKQWEVVSKVES